MIVSNDKKCFFIANPKTGTRTVFDVIKGNGIFLGEHPRVAQTIGSFKLLDPTFDYAAIEKVYVFWRDPVERFISAVNFLRSSSGGGALLRRNRSWFPSVTLADPELPEPMTPLTKITITDEILSLLEAVTPEQIFEDEMARLASPCPSGLFHVLQKQSLWMDGSDKMVVLNYANFEANLKRVAADFGVDCGNLVVPVLNKSPPITTSLSANLEAQVRRYYAEDYDVKIDY